MRDVEMNVEMLMKLSWGMNNLTLEGILKMVKKEEGF
jgi:hypothetical protein